MQKILIAESAGIISKSIGNHLDEEWEIHVCSNGYEAADMLKYLRPSAAIIDSSLLRNHDLTFLEDFSVLIGISSPTSERIVDIVNAIVNPPRLIVQHLQALGFNLNLDGSRFLIAAIPLYAKDPAMQLHKELYPAVQELCNATSIASVERSIRVAIHAAWEQRNISKWSQYFPNSSDEDASCPSNKTFIFCIAQKL